MRTDLTVLGGILAIAFLSMPVFSLLRRGQGRDPLDLADRGSFVLGSFVRDWLYWFIGPVERIALALRISPTAFNLLGVGFGVVAGLLFAAGRLNLAGWAVLLGGLADIFDGRVARARGLAGERGAFLDSTLDRFTEVAAFIGLVVLYRAAPWAAAVVAAGLGGSLLVSYTRARGESVGVVCKVGIMQRAERLLLVGFGAILDPSVCSWQGWAPGSLLLGILAVVAVGTVGTAVYRTSWIAARLP